MPINFLGWLLLMETSMIHRLWHLIDSTQTNDITGRSDGELVQFLASQLIAGQPVSEQKESLIQSYIGTRLHLIRDLVSSGF